MKLNWDVVRKVLREVEALPTEDSEFDSDALRGVDHQEAAYHMRRLIEAGYVAGSCRDVVGAPVSCTATRLTMAGHLFLAQISNDGVWNQVKTKARKLGLDLSFDVIKRLAAAAIDGLIGG